MMRWYSFERIWRCNVLRGLGLSLFLCCLIGNLVRLKQRTLSGERIRCFSLGRLPIKQQRNRDIEMKRKEKANQTTLFRLVSAFDERRNDEEVESEAAGKDDAHDIHFESNGEGEDGDAEKPEEKFAEDGLGPAWLSAARRNTGGKRGPEARDGFQIGQVGCTLCLAESVLFAKGETVAEQQSTEDDEEPTGAAGEKSDASHHGYVCEIERIAKITIRTVGDERFGMLADVVDNFGAEISGGAGAEKSREEDKKSAGGKDDAEPVVAEVAIWIDGRSDEVKKRHGEVGVIDGRESETKANDEAKNPEAVFELKFSGAHAGKPPRESE
jgi:hypothetical protein